MSQTLLTAALLMLMLPVSGQERQLIYLHRMDGLEVFVQEALRDTKLPFTFIEQMRQPDLKSKLDKMDTAYGEVLYLRRSGEKETHRLELREVAGNRIIASHDFALGKDDESKKGVAKEFASKVKKALEKPQ